MKITKRIDLGEYVIIITHDNIDGSLEINVLDELDELIETMNIKNEDNNEIDPQLN